METLLVEIKHPKAMSLLKDLEDLSIIRLLKNEAPKKAKKKLSEIFAGSISQVESDTLNEYIQTSRNEWEKNI